MGLLKKIILLTIAYLATFPLSLFADNDGNNIEDYNRSSLYTIYILHPGTEMYNPMFKTLLNVKQSDRFNDHHLSLRLMDSKGSPDKKQLQRDITTFLQRNKIAQRLVSKWFNRDKNDGSFDMELIKERGNYNATVEDINYALHTTRGKAMLEDAGEQLVGNTFVIVNDVTYINKRSKAELWQALFMALTMVGQLSSIKSSPKIITSAGAAGAIISSLVAGFSVKIDSYLYKLVWNQDIADKFYSEYYFDKVNLDPAKKNLYQANANNFKLEYIGSFGAQSGKTVIRGIKKEEDVFMKVLTRTIDENIVELHKRFDVFKITAPLYKVDSNGNILVHIGLKEGVTPDSKYEVLERVENKDGKISYKRYGILKPIEDKIWDNRFMAVEEGAENSEFGYTTFKKVSGGNFYPGMLIREIK